MSLQNVFDIFLLFFFYSGQTRPCITMWLNCLCFDLSCVLLPRVNLLDRLYMKFGNLKSTDVVSYPLSDRKLREIGNHIPFS
ncbi:methyltransferase [Histoplasma capsulatum var. duboisii H88]|uniref:Methyltransferase n=1 Tax=Ajellomyces capsulatus (strain H88) TaxID=544711 RepID=A0A8A1LTE1_AJEC8|nr:methyltransferase [Histoplasma capsulatum var. duboisii H88]